VGERRGEEREGGRGERRRGEQWGSDAGEGEAIRVGAMPEAGDPGRSSLANADKFRSGPGPTMKMPLLPVVPEPGLGLF
jgi:hypothetical protein